MKKNAFVIGLVLLAIGAIGFLKYVLFPNKGKDNEGNMVVVSNPVELVSFIGLMTSSLYYAIACSHY